MGVNIVYLLVMQSKQHVIKNNNEHKKIRKMWTMVESNNDHYKQILRCRRCWDYHTKFRMTVIEMNKNFVGEVERI